MPRPLILIDSISTPEGRLELRRRGDRDFMILVGGRVLMTTVHTTSELAVATHGIAAAAELREPRVLIGGLGLGFTLRRALELLPPAARVVVAELHAKIVEWCRGPVSAINGEAVLDARVRCIVGDVREQIRRVASNEKLPRYDAILWDLYVGPKSHGGDRDPLYGKTSLEAVHRALSPHGTFTVWGETPSPAFERRLQQQGFTQKLVRTAGAGLKHAVYVATKTASPDQGPGDAQKSKVH